MLKREEGGRHTPFFAGYRPQFYIRTMDVTGSVILPAGVEMVMPGDRVDMEVQLITPMALDAGNPLCDPAKVAAPSALASSPRSSNRRSSSIALNNSGRRRPTGVHLPD